MRIFSYLCRQNHQSIYRDMKKILSTGLMALLLTALLSLGACAGKKYDLMKYVSDSDAVTVTGRMADVLRNAGAKVDGDHWKVTPQLRRLLDEAHDDFYVGLDAEHVTYTLNLADGYCIMTCGIYDVSHMRQSLMGPMRMHRVDDAEGLELYTDNNKYYFAIDGDMLIGFGGFNGQTAAEVLSTAAANAAEHPLPAWKQELLDGASTAQALVNIEALKAAVPSMQLNFPGYDPEALASATVAMSAQLEKDSFTLTARLHNAEGTVMTNELQLPDVDLSMLDYAPAPAVAAVVAPIKQQKDLRAILNNLFTQTVGFPPQPEAENNINAVADFVGKIDGTLMIAAGPTELLRATSLQGWAVTIAVQMAPGAAAEYVAMAAQSMASAPGATIPVEGGFRTDALELGAPLTIKADGDVLLISTLADPRRGSDHPYIDASALRGTLGGWIVRLPKDHPVMALLGSAWGLDMTLTSTQQEMKLSVDLTGTDKPMFEALITAFSRL